jgi:hypothetical protein
MEEFDEAPPPSRPKPSKIPSWIMLGFVLGALFVWALPNPRAPRASPTPTPPAVPPLAFGTHPRFTEVEAAFERWKEYALWADDVTYVCLWDSAETRTFRDCFQVLRRGDDLFYRSVPRPRDLRAREGVPEECPLQFLNPVPEVRRLFGLPVEDFRPPK